VSWRLLRARGVRRLPGLAGGRALAELRFEPVLIQVTEGLEFVMPADDSRTMGPARTPAEAG
jgi:hypothetical protein